MAHFNVVSHFNLSFTQLPLSGTPYPILFVLLCLFHPFCLGLRLTFFLHSFSLSFRTDLLDFGTGTGISFSGSVFSSQGWCVCILLWPLRAYPKSSSDDNTVVKIN